MASGLCKILTVYSAYLCMFVHELCIKREWERRTGCAWLAAGHGCRKALVGTRLGNSLLHCINGLEKCHLSCTTCLGGVQDRGKSALGFSFESEMKIKSVKGMHKLS